jgi:hypothetical protein
LFPLSSIETLHVHMNSTEVQEPPTPSLSLPSWLEVINAWQGIAVAVFDAMSPHSRWLEGTSQEWGQQLVHDHTSAAK